MKVVKVAEIDRGIITIIESREYKSKEISEVLLNLELAKNPRPDCEWVLQVYFPETSFRPPQTATLTLGTILDVNDPSDSAVILSNDRLIHFGDRLFLVDRSPKNDTEREEILLRSKLMVFEERNELARLKSRVANFEAALKYAQSGPNRNPIPEDVKLAVWARDGGACVRCGSKEELHFDHIIPVAKGGGNSEANIQILCQRCNLLKSDKISI